MGEAVRRGLFRLAPAGRTAREEDTKRIVHALTEGNARLPRALAAQGGAGFRTPKWKLHYQRSV